MEEEIPEVVEEVEAAVEGSDEPTQETGHTQEIKDEIKLMRDHMDLMAQRLEKPAEPVDDYQDPVEKMQQQLDRQSIEIAESRIMTKHADYKEVITKYLPQAIKENPDLMKELSPTAFETAYYVAKSSKAYIKDKTLTPKTQEAKKAVENTEKIGSLSGIGSATAGSSEPNFLRMTDDEFLAYKRSREDY